MNLEIKRHSLAHVIAQAVKELYPNVKLAIGPATDDWFYYDFDFGEIEFSDKNLKNVEKKMKKIISQNQLFEQFNLSINDAISKLKEDSDIYKLELVEKLKQEGETELSFYKNISQQWDTKFVDMCRGPHITKMSELDTNSFKLSRVAWAYWLGDENNPQLTRIYAYAFDNRDKLQAHLKMLEEAKKRDHRVLWKKLELFTFDKEVWPGLPLWLPAWAIMVEETEKLAKETEESYWYDRVRSPHITKWKLYYKSWHLPYYKEDMFPPMILDNEEYYLKPMNCPHHHKIFDAIPKSYKDLPLRYAEYWHCYRNEDSWSLFGLMRVRSLCMNDAHIYCTNEQFENEFIAVIEMYKYYFKLFWIDKFEMRLSKHSKKWLGKKYVDNEELWIKSEEQVRNALNKMGVPYKEVEDEAAFYWPKIDVQIWSSIWKEFTLATNQLDFAVPAKFELTYKDKDWKNKTPLCIHRTPLSTHERFIWFLIEHFAWIFPLWIAPRQVKIVPVTDKFFPYAKKVEKELKNSKIRVTWDYASDWLNKKIRKAEKMHNNYILVVWEQEEKDESISIRNYRTKEQTVEKVKDFKNRIILEIKERRL